MLCRLLKDMDDFYEVIDIHCYVCKFLIMDLFLGATRNARHSSIPKLRAVIKFQQRRIDSPMLESTCHS